MSLLEIKDLHAGFEGTEIVKGVSLTVNPGEIHAIMGPNGSGKSTLSKVLAGHPSYDVMQGSITFNGKDLLEMDAEERALAGVFLGFQYPVEIPGVNNAEFLRMAYNAKLVKRGEDEVDPLDFDEILDEKMKLVGMDRKYKDRFLNEGFSGGEKKKNEILQMAVLDPVLAVLDETDSGLDIDALKVVAQGVNKLIHKDNALVMITHYQRLLNYIEPQFVHVFSGGKIVKSGGKELAHELEEQGYDWVTAPAQSGN
ncbi:MAG: Fe-S cluster assembly ATPase SufC [Nitrospinaceae bacterium]|nr:Fe-S cluster assembly ATPase SufC [Nitrospinaceae bacterium]NIR54044.1 Fe-S cluster assembly ATPase SufC [Nitrospinaceae bacterium]NIS84461.1 Fe-S cluster assembly ATPase SufC [Nitrospinaceae bacterium]NIT81257.1 Fe-S cluster assembly ATPase SufC [Nitrospinaceae bacterium]NIU43544.1 Fe-S cluster assembly ATPase SufC [Nitrospinaceae bacterium]